MLLSIFVNGKNHNSGFECRKTIKNPLCTNCFAFIPKSCYNHRVMSYISLKGVSYSYPLGEGHSLKALKNLSFSVEKGSFIALVGKNGSGKSTLAKLLNGLFLPSSGEVVVDGMSTADEKFTFEIRKKVGMVFQNPDNQTVATMVEDDVAFGPENIGVPRDEIIERVSSALDAVGMSEYRNRPVSKLSGGQKQRVAIAGVLAMRPEVIVFDESTAMLDPVGRKEIMAIAKSLHDKGITVINITHNMDEASLADRIIVMSKGQIVLDGTPKEVFGKGDLSAYGLSLPAPTETALTAKNYGYSFDDVVVTIDELTDGILENVGQKQVDFDIPSPAPKQSVKAVEIENLSFVYSKKTPSEKVALDDVNLTINEGEFVALIGKTGSGKSTFIQHLNGLIKCQSGEVKIYGKSAKEKKNLKNLRYTVGMVFQYPEYQLFEDTVAKDVAFGPKNMKLSADEVNERVRKAMDLVGLPYDKFAERSPFELSGGEKRRAAIAGVIAMDPKILILDEPFAGLDPAGIKDVTSLIVNLQRTVCPTIIMVSHSMDAVAEIADRIIALQDGKLVADGMPSEIFKDRKLIEDIGLDLPFPATTRDNLESKGIVLPSGVVKREHLSTALKLLKGGRADV